MTRPSCWLDKVERFINRNGEGERRDQTTIGYCMRRERRAAESYATALRRQFECGQRRIQVQTGPRIYALHPGSLQPDALAFVITQNMQ